MNEVKTVHLGRQQFTIAVDAHKALQEYLHAIHKQPGVQPEVVKEVEMRMAELLLERGVTGDKVVLPEDVDFLKQQLGEPRDFKDDEAADDKTGKTAKDDKESRGDEQDAPRRLYRDTQNGLIAGVASGLAAYMGIDVLLVRILFVVLTFASGAGILLYILIWILAPDARTPSERLQMRGKAVTVDSLKEVIDRADIPGAGRRAGQAADQVGQGAAAIAANIAKAILAVIGVGFTLAGIGAMLSSVTLGTYMLIHGSRLGTETIFPQNGNEVWFVALAAGAVLILGLFLFMIGLAMVSRKWRLPGWMVATLLGIFLAASGVGTALGIDIFPQLRQRYQDSQHTVTRQLPAFSSATLEGEDTAYEFVADTTYSVQISYLGDLDLKPLKTEIKDGVLVIKSDNLHQKDCWGFCLYEDRDMKIVIHAPVLEKVTLAGQDNSFRSYEQLKQEALTLELDDVNDNKMILNRLESAESVFSADGGKRSLTLRGIKPGAPFDATVQLGEYNTLVSRTGIFQLSTPDRCEADEPLMFLRDTPDEVIVNGQSIKGREALLRARDAERRSDINCVLIR